MKILEYMHIIIPISIYQRQNWEGEGVKPAFFMEMEQELNNKMLKKKQKNPGGICFGRIMVICKVNCNTF